jgi:hypothetical protein
MFSAQATNEPPPDQAAKASYWEERRKTVQAQFAVRPLTPQEQRAADDETWALKDAEVQATYRGQFVVPFERKIVAHGPDAEQVLAEAARATGRSVEELPLVGIDEPLLDISH